MKSKNRFFALLAAVLMLASVFCMPAIAAIEGASSTVSVFQYQNVKKDLSSGLVEGLPFSVERYPYIENADDGMGRPKMELISFYEYGYSELDPSAARYEDYSLFLYLYNPGNIELQVKDNRFKITFAVGEGSKDWRTYPLYYCSAAGDDQGHEFLYYKFRVGISAEDLRALMGDAKERVYELSEFELVLYEGDLNATAFPVGGQYVYTGTMAGYGAGDFACRVKERLTITLDCHSVVYRTDKNAANDGIKNQLDSVYFTVPNEILREYGKLYGAKFEYYEYSSGYVAGFKNDAGYNMFKPQEGVTVGYNSDLKTLAAGFTRLTGNGNPGSQNDVYADWAYNIDRSYYDWSLNGYADMLTYVFKYDSGAAYDQILKTGVETHFSEQWRRYNQGHSSALIQKLFPGNKSDHYVCRELFNDGQHDYHINSFNGNWFQAMFDLDSGYTEQTLKPIEEVTLSSFDDIEKNLFVGSSYSGEMWDAFSAARFSDQTVYLLRFAESEYFALEFDATSSIISKDYEGMVAKENIYMDFDVLSLTFSKDGQETVIPVVSSPINVIGGIETPSGPAGSIFSFEDGMPQWLKIVLIVLAVIVVLLLLPVLWPVLKVILQALLWLLLLPFRGIAALIRKIQDRGK